MTAAARTLSGEHDGRAGAFRGGLRAISGCRLAAVVAFIARAGLGLGGAEGAGDALVGGISLTVDAVSSCGS